jgi:hypothetical protein
MSGDRAKQQGHQRSREQKPGRFHGTNALQMASRHNHGNYTIIKSTSQPLVALRVSSSDGFNRPSPARQAVARIPVQTQLPADQRVALILVGASGFSGDEAAHICECAVLTIKPRVNRAHAAVLPKKFHPKLLTTH